MKRAKTSASDFAAANHAVKARYAADFAKQLWNVSAFLEEGPAEIMASIPEWADEKPYRVHIDMGGLVTPVRNDQVRFGVTVTGGKYPLTYEFTAQKKGAAKFFVRPAQKNFS